MPSLPCQTLLLLLSLCQRCQWLLLLLCQSQQKGLLLLQGRLPVLVQSQAAAQPWQLLWPLVRLLSGRCCCSQAAAAPEVASC
jgi:hypothetical protein